jgi:hypothetical protein
MPRKGNERYPFFNRGKKQTNKQLLAVVRPADFDSCSANHPVYCCVVLIYCKTNTVSFVNSW